MTSQLEQLLATTLPEQLADLVSTLPPTIVEALLADGTLDTNRTQPPAAPTPLQLGMMLNNKVGTAPELELINTTLVDAYNTQDGRQLIAMPPQRGKSQLSSRWFPLWALNQNRDLRVAVASYEANIARRWGRAVRDDIENYGPQLGMKVRHDLSSQSEWQLEGHDGGLFTTGIGGAMTGRSVDLLIIDDPVKGREQADSPVIQQRTWDWFTDTALTRLAPGATVVIIQTRWSQNDLTGRLLKHQPGVWENLVIPAQATDDGDPIGRQSGEYLKDVRGTTIQQWEQIKQAAGPKTWASLYQGNPRPEEGNTFPSNIPTYEHPLWVQHSDGTHHVHNLWDGDKQLIQSWDLTFTGTKTSDYVVGQVWLREGANTYLLDQYRQQADFTTTLQAIQDMRNKWPQTGAVLVEAAANGHAAINMLKRSVPGIIPITPRGSKGARADAVAPFIWSGNMHLPSSRLLPNVTELREEMLNFPSAAHDDTVDALTQALTQLMIHPTSNKNHGLVRDLFSEDQWTISPY